MVDGETSPVRGASPLGRRRVSRAQGTGVSAALALAKR
jgi:hypothetical protein